MEAKARKPAFSLKGSVFANLRWYDYAIVIAIYVVLSLLAVHGDIYHTARSSFALLEGHVADFYEYNKGVVGGNDYDIFIYLIFALWNLPMFLSGRTVPWGPAPAYIMLYEKLLLIVFLILSAWMIYKICVMLGTKHKIAFYASFLFMTIPYMLTTAVAYGMYDILYVFFMLWGLRWFLDDAKKQNVFISALLFGLSFSIKPLAVFLFLPILLYRYKNILRCALLLLISMIPVVLFKMPYMGAPSTMSSRFIDYLFGTAYANGVWIIPVFILSYAIVCLWAYHARYEEHNHIKTIYIGLLGMMPFYAFISWHPQWLLLFGSLSAILVACNKNKGKLLLFDGVLSVAFIGFLWQAFGTAFKNGTIPLGIMAKVNVFRMETPFLGDNIFPPEYVTAYIAVMIAVIVFSAYCLNPWKFGEEYTGLQAELTVRDMWYARLRFLIPLAIYLVPMLIWIVAARG